MLPSRYHPTLDRITQGSRVGLRTDSRPIGTVDALGAGGGSRWAVVSWPAVGHPAAPVDGRGRRGQVFDLAALLVLDPAAPPVPDPDLPEE